MSTLREAAQQALEALQWHYRQGHSNTLGGFRLKIDEKALRELSAALAQQDEPVQEPVAEVFVRRDGVSFAFWLKAPPPERTKLYTAPPQRKPLTEEVATLIAQRDALLEALRPFAETDLTNPTVRDTFGFDVLFARAAIKAAEETK